MDDILKGLNAAQKTAVASEAEVLQVLAPPGSGKTKTLTARVAHLVAHQGLLPWNIIVCTFTVKAANEMKERIKNFVGEDLSKQLKLGTFHSVALRYLKTYGQHIDLPKDFGIADSSDSKAILKRLIKRLGSSIEPGQALGRISSRKIKDTEPQPGKAPKNVEQQQFDALFDEYEATLAASNLLDYDDILLRCAKLLRSHPQCVSNVQAVLIDEFQDTNNIQYDLMRLFARQRNVITIVGDPDQSIYGWRCAEIKNLTRMKKQWPDTLTINLEENYRSSGAILHAAQNIIEQDESRPPKKLQATHTFGLRPVLRKLPSAQAEAEWLVSEIKRIQCMSGKLLDLSDFAVLLRSAQLSRAIEAALGHAGIAYRMVGGTRFYDRFEVKLIVDYLRVIHSTENSEAVERIVNVPPRRVGDVTIKNLREEAQLKGMTFWTLILDIAQARYIPSTKVTEPCRKGLTQFVNVVLSGRKKVEAWTAEEPSVVGLINFVTQKIGLQAYLKDKYSEEETFEARWSNVEELMAQAEEVTRPEMLKALVEADGLPVLQEIEQRSDADQEVLSIFLANIALTASAEKQAEENGEKAQQVTISTIHAAKGLEWPVVFIPACYDGSIPHSRADDHDEERRLLYVGMTRAQALLYLSCPIKNTQREETNLSLFLTHAGVSSFFEEHGPSLPPAAVTSLSITLRRECPNATTLTESKQALERDEDNYWPLNGEEPLEELAKWDRHQTSTSSVGFISARTHTATSMQQGFSTASATMPVPQQGFVSVASRYDELMEQAQLRKLDKRAEEQKHAEAQQPKGRKRQIEGQGNIASFFAKKSRASPEKEDPPPAPAPPFKTTRPLQDIPANRAPMSSFAPARQALPAYKPKSTPMFSKPSTAKPKPPPSTGRENSSSSGSQYVFLSSSPPPPDPEDEPPPTHLPPEEDKQIDKASAPSFKPATISRQPSHEKSDTVAPLPAFKPASTFHTTSMQHVSTAGPPQRKTLGVRRSMNGWNSRTHK